MEVRSDYQRTDCGNDGSECLMPRLVFELERLGHPFQVPKIIDS